MRMEVCKGAEVIITQRISPFSSLPPTPNHPPLHRSSQTINYQTIRLQFRFAQEKLWNIEIGLQAKVRHRISS